MSMNPESHPADGLAPTLLLHHLTTGYAHRGATKVVARDINAQLMPGELTCLLGPNGAGKSTLLRTLSAFLSKVEGEILLDGAPLESFKPAELRGKSVWCSPNA